MSLDVSSRCQCKDFIRATATDRGHDAGQSTSALLAGGGTYRAIGSISMGVHARQSVLGHGGVTTEEEENEPKVWTAC